VILGYDNQFPPDATERALPDPASARVLIARDRPDILDWVARRHVLLAQHYGSAAEPTIARAGEAFLLGLARLGLRHGRFGNDFHAYHNEGHILEVADRRLITLERAIGINALPLMDWLMLGLFAACHDLRQRESSHATSPVGGNEAASAAETMRILDVCGYDREHDRALYVTMELAIAGSTFGFQARPLTNSAEAAIGGGALARHLPGWLDQVLPDWRLDRAIPPGLQLARLAADLDTANAGEPYEELADSAIRLCQEHEMRENRALDSPESALSALKFLSDGQEHYFFELHHFASREGEHVFGAGKAANAPRVRAVSAALRAQFADTPPANANAVIAAYSKLSGCP
jgi:hypothetical protein